MARITVSRVKAAVPKARINIVSAVASGWSAKPMPRKAPRKRSTAARSAVS